MPDWWITRDGDLDCLAIYERHYSAYRYADGRGRRLFVGPGEKLVLRTDSADAMFGQAGLTDLFRTSLGDVKDKADGGESV